MLRKLLKKFMGKPEAESPPEQSADNLPADWDAGDKESRARLIEFVYPQLKRIAEYHMRRERSDHTLQPTALVNEFFLILARQRSFTFKNRAHFLAIASRAMRRLLIDYARSHKAESNGGASPKLQLDADVKDASADFDVLQIDELLDRLEEEEPRMAKVVELKCFGGLTFSEIAQVLGVDERTAKRDWQVARAWLYGHLKPKKHPDAC
jgi:RNA polymerase sigma-70 factor, ECF subfamily